MTEKAQIILQRWCKSKGINPGKLAKDTGYSYSAAWKALRYQHYKPSDDMLGRLLRVYGTTGPAIEMAKAMQE